MEVVLVTRMHVMRSCNAHARGEKNCVGGSFFAVGATRNTFVLGKVYLFVTEKLDAKFNLNFFKALINLLMFQKLLQK